MSPPDVIMRPQGGWLFQKSWLSEREAIQCIRSREFRGKQIRGSGYKDQETILRSRTIGEYYQQIINMDQHRIQACGNAIFPLVQPLGGTVERVMEQVVKIATTTSVQPPPGFCCSIPASGRYTKPNVSDVDAENQKTLLLRKFFLDSINSESMVKADRRTKDIYRTLLIHMTPEKLKEITFDFLKGVGFDGILSHKSICSDAIFDDLAQEVCFNDTLIYEIVSACNAFTADKKRMQYVGILEYYAYLLKNN